MCHDCVNGMKEAYLADHEVGGVDVGAVYRAEYLHAIEMARATNDPCEDWDGFVEELWSGLASAFGLDVEVLDASEHDLRLDGLQGPSE